MYPWVTHMHSVLGGECPHHCVYCYVDNPINGRPIRYTGPICLIEKEMNVDYGSGKVIFIGHQEDLFARQVPTNIIKQVINHCKCYNTNEYVFQTKNPSRYFEINDWPEFTILGTTIETNREDFLIKEMDVPTPFNRFTAMST